MACPRASPPTARNQRTRARPRSPAATTHWTCGSFRAREKSVAPHPTENDERGLEPTHHPRFVNPAVSTIPRVAQLSPSGAMICPAYDGLRLAGRGAASGLASSAPPPPAKRALLPHVAFATPGAERSGALVEFFPSPPTPHLENTATPPACDQPCCNTRDRTMEPIPAITSSRCTRPVHHLL